MSEATCYACSAGDPCPNHPRSEPVIVHTHCQHPEARIAAISAKCSDCCIVQLGDWEHAGYVPDGWGVGGGDYVEFKWCLDCGVIVGPRWPLTPEPEEE